MLLLRRSQHGYELGVELDELLQLRWPTATASVRLHNANSSSHGGSGRAAPAPGMALCCATAITPAHRNLLS